MTKLETMTNDYMNRKKELEEAMKAELSPLWEAIVAEQKALKAAKIKAKKEARILTLEAELKLLKADTTLLAEVN